MRLVRDAGRVEGALRGAVAALGNFDGVHLGHRAVIAETRRIAAARGLPSAVVTFEPHPRMLFQPDAPPFRLTSLEGKARVMAELGLDALFVLTFDDAFAHLAAESFVADVLAARLGLGHVVVGHDFQFGHRRRGTPEMLDELGGRLGYGVTVLDAVHEADGAIYSSTRVRQCLSEGDPRGAAALLGRPWEIEATVEAGDRRGRTLGFPTANLRLGEFLRPAFGVYAVRVAIDDEGAPAWLGGVANLGRRPTVEDRGVLLEAHLFDADLDLYGKQLRVAFHDFIRPEQRFAGLDALKAQIAADCAAARALLMQRAGA